jgi:hypothetical protein
MTRPKNVEEAAQNRLIDEGIAGVKSKLYRSYTEAANELKVPQSTMTHRACGQQMSGFRIMTRTPCHGAHW